MKKPQIRIAERYSDRLIDDPQLAIRDPARALSSPGLNRGGIVDEDSVAVGLIYLTRARCEGINYYL